MGEHIGLVVAGVTGVASNEVGSLGRKGRSCATRREDSSLADKVEYIALLVVGTRIFRWQGRVRVWVGPLGNAVAVSAGLVACEASPLMRGFRALALVARDVHVGLLAIGQLIDRAELYSILSVV